MGTKFDFTRRDGCEDTYCQQGATFYHDMIWDVETAPGSDEFSEVQLEGWSAKMQVRKKPGTPVIVELSTSNNRIVLGPGGLIVLSISREDTALLPAGLYEYDLHLVDPDGFDTVLIEGLFQIAQGITQ